MTLHNTNAGTTDNEKLKVSLAASFLLSLTLFFFGPGTLYYTNIREIPFSFSNNWYYILAIVLVVGFILSLLLWWLKESTHTTASALVFTLGLLFWIQGNILVWDYGLFDGHEIIFENYFWNGVIDSLTWIGILIAGVLYSKRLYHHIAVVCSLLIITQAAGLMATAYSAPDESEWKNLQYSPDHKNMYEFSTNMNVIVIILDTFQSDIFQEIINENPEYSNMFDGFIYYRNNVGGFAHTDPSIMYILSGKFYDNSVPFSKFIKDTSLQNSLPLLLKENGVRVDIKTRVPGAIFPSSEVYDTIDGYSFENHVGFSARNISEITPIYQLTFFRFVPQALKQYFYGTLSEELSSLTPKGAIENDMNVYSNFNSAIRVSAPERIFKLFHLKGSHVPFNLNENLKYVKLPQNITGYKSQTKASLKICHALLESLKRNSSYDNSLIFIIGDHGGKIERSENAIAPNSGLPLMLVKPFNSTGPLAISDSPVSLGDIPKTIADELKIKNNFSGSSIFLVNETDPRVRIYYEYDWLENDLKNDYFSPLSEFRISGFSWNISSWQPTYHIYTSEGVISTMEESTTKNVDPEIRIISPANGETVPTHVLVNGNISGEIPKDRYMWVIVNPKLTDQYWPQGESHIIPIKGEWSLSVHIGEDKYHGGEFDIIVVLVDKITDQNYISWVNDGKATSNYPGIKIDKNIKLVGKITVIKE